jgi:putative transposase
MLISHRIALDPNDAQATYFVRAAGVARFAYNWALSEWKYEAGGKPSEASLRRTLNSLKPSEFPWMLEVTKNAPQQAVKNLGAAFRRFFAGQGPKFKKKGVHDSFRADNGTDKDHKNAVEIHGKGVRLPVIGWVRMREPLRFRGKILSAVVSRTAERWFVSLTVEVEHQTPVRENQAAGGVDLGVCRLATFSDGGGCEGPKALRRSLARLKRLSRSLSHKVKGSRNRGKAKARIARLHDRMTNIRQDALHKLTTSLVRRFTILGIEDLNVRGMMANDPLARSIADMGFHEFRRQLEYKAAMHGSRIVVADRFFASSKTCSACGAVLEALALSVREWDCPSCGAHHDRDVNAAKNLPNLAVSSTAAACGEIGSGLSRETRVKPASLKQEPGVEATHA